MAFSSTNQKSLDRCKQFVLERAGGAREGGPAAQQCGEEAEGCLEMGLNSCILRRQGKGEPGGSERGIFISKHISPLIDYGGEGATATKPGGWNEAGIQGLIPPRPYQSSDA